MNKFQRMILLSLTTVSLFSMAINIYAAPVPINSIVAVVNDQIITQNQLDQQTAITRLALQQENQPMPSTPELQKKALNQLIGTLLEQQFAKNHKITITDAQVNESIASIAKQNHLTVAQMEAIIQKQGMSIDSYKKQMKQQLLTQTLLAKVPGYSASITQSEISQTIAKIKNQIQPSANAYHLQGLFIAYTNPPTSASKLAVQEEAMSALESLQAGQDYNTVAVNLSSNIPVAAQDMGWKSLNQLPPQLAERLMSAQVNGVVGPVISPTGIYVFKVAGIKKMTQPAPTEAELTAQAKNILFQQHMIANEKKFIDSLKKQAYIKINLPS